MRIDSLELNLSPRARSNHCNLFAASEPGFSPTHIRRKLSRAIVFKQHHPVLGARCGIIDRTRSL